MNIRMITNSELLTESKQQKQEVSKQLEQEQHHISGDHLEVHQWGRERGRMREKVQGLRSIIGRYKIVRC